MAQAFDTLAAARQMEAAGMDRAQAEAVACAARDAASAGRGDLVTTADLETAVSKLEAGLTWRMVILAGVVVAAVKLIP